MWKKLYRTLSLPISIPFFLLRFNGIWGLKEHLSHSDNPKRELIEIFDAYFRRYGSWIGYDSYFAGIPCFPHGYYGVFISGGAKLGKNVVIFQHVTIGSNVLNDSDRVGSPTIGDNVYIGAGAKIIGEIVIGENCRIGANAVVYRDMPSNSVAVQSPTRIIQKSNLDNRYYSRRDGRRVYYNDGDWVEDDGEIQ